MKKPSKHAFFKLKNENSIKTLLWQTYILQTEHSESAVSLLNPVTVSLNKVLNLTGEDTSFY
jgi:hypothetical protein